MSVRERDRVVAIHGVAEGLVQRTLSNGRICVNNTAVMSFFGSTQNNVLAAPSQKNSPTAPEDSCASFGGAMRTAKSMPKPTCPLLGSQDLSVTSFGMASVAMSFTVSGLRMRARPELPAA